MMGNQVFLDSAYAIALASRSDEYHQKAERLSQYIANNAVKLVTNRAVCLEIGNALAKLPFRRVAVEFLAALDSAPTVEIVPASEDLYRTAFALFQRRTDKAWSLTDCFSFIVMQQRGITEALTSDEHFEQAGFKALLRRAD